MHTAEIAFVEYVKRVHFFYNFELDAWKLAHMLGLSVVRGPYNSICGKVISLTSDVYGNRRASARAIRHEIAHYLMQKSGVEGELLRLSGSFEAGLPSLERLSFHGSLVLHMPDQVLDRACQQHGNTPATLLHLCELGDAELAEALRRWVYAEVGAARAAWVVKNSLVVDVAAANMWLPFWKYDELTSPSGDLPDAAFLPVQGRQMLGTVAW
jgi:hypothetical protein